MIEIKDLLVHFNEILFSSENKKETIRKIISESIKKEIKTKDIEIKNNIIYLNIKPIYKNEIFIKQEEIFNKLKTALGAKIPKKIS